MQSVMCVLNMQQSDWKNLMFNSYFSPDQYVNDAFYDWLLDVIPYTLTYGEDLDEMVKVDRDLLDYYYGEGQ